MAISLTPNAQYDQFVRFAAASGEKDIARLDATDNLGTRTVTAQKDDHIGAVMRSCETKVHNEAARAAFKSAVESMFGGASRIPENVRAAMQLEDFGKGKPLTARRILAVRLAVDEAAAALDLAVQEATDKFTSWAAYDTLSPAEQARGRALVATAVKMCAGDKDALDSVVGNIVAIMVDGAQHLRSDASVTGKVDGILSNFKEIHTLAEKDYMVLHSGKMLMIDLRGKSLPAGAIASLLTAAKGLDISAIKKFASHPGALNLDRAIRQLRTNEREGMVSSGVEKLLEGGEEKDPCRSFLVSLMAARCGSSALKKMQAAFDSDSSKKLMTFYYEIFTGNFNKNDISLGRAEATAMAADSQIKSLNTFKMEIELQCGVDRANVRPLDPLKGPQSYDDIDAGVVFFDLLEEGKASVAKEREAFLNSVVKGTGAGADLLRGVYDDLLGPEPHAPSDDVRFRNESVTRAKMNIAICEDCHRLALGQQSKFETSLAGLTVNLPGGATLAKDFPTAREQLTKLITGDDQATYAGVNDPVTKNKIHIAMSMLSSAAVDAAYDGLLIALDPNRNKNAYTIGHDASKEVRTISLLFSSFGGLEINFSGTRAIQTITTSKGTAQAGPGSTENMDFTFQFSSNTLDEFAKLDFARFDGTAASQTLVEANGTHNVERAAQALGQGFALKEGTGFCRVQHFTSIN